MKIYAVSGLGADERVFKFLKLDHELIPIKWIVPLSYFEPISSYAHRLSVQIDSSDQFMLLGVSFGGLIVSELSKSLKPAHTILISSTDTKHGIRPIFRLFKGVLPFLPRFILKPPKVLANWIFGAKNKQLLTEILHDTDLHFSKWAIIQLASWDNISPLIHCTKISGDHDKLIAAENDMNTILIKNGAHFMVVDKANEISRIINEIQLTNY